MATAGCGLRLYRAAPEELAQLSAEANAALAELRSAVVAAATAWQFATREREIAELQVAAVDAKRDVPASLAAWAEAATLADRKALNDDLEREHAYCRARYAELEAVIEREWAWVLAQLEAAEAAEHEARRRYELADLELGRAQAAYALDRPGVLKEDRSKELARWDTYVQRARKRVQAALAERRGAEIRREDQRKAWLGMVYDLQRRFDRPCAVDWALPERGATATAPAADVRSTERDPGPLAAEPTPAAASAATVPVAAPAAVSDPERPRRWRPSL